MTYKALSCGEQIALQQEVGKLLNDLDVSRISLTALQQKVEELRDRLEIEEEANNVLANRISLLEAELSELRAFKTKVMALLPVSYEARSKRKWDDWNDWGKCNNLMYAKLLEDLNTGQFQYEVRKLYDLSEILK